AGLTKLSSCLLFVAPGAVRLEMRVVQWLAGLVVYPPETAGGDLTSGGSIANLSAVVAAREAHGIKAANLPRHVVYMSEQRHHSMDKALRIAGLSECVRRSVPVDTRYRMRADALAGAVAADRKAGLVPWLALATAGTTDVGAVDPVNEIADIAAAEALW